MLSGSVIRATGYFLSSAPQGCGFQTAILTPFKLLSARIKPHFANRRQGNFSLRQIAEHE